MVSAVTHFFRIAQSHDKRVLSSGKHILNHDCRDMPLSVKTENGSALFHFPSHFKFSIFSIFRKIFDGGN